MYNIRLTDVSKRYLPTISKFSVFFAIWVQRFVRYMAMHSSGAHCMRKSSNCVGSQNGVPTNMFERHCMCACVITLLCILNVSEYGCLCVCIAISNVAVYSIHRGLYSLAVHFSTIVEIHQHYERIHRANVCWVYVHVDRIVLPCCICRLILL